MYLSVYIHNLPPQTICFRKLIEKEEVIAHISGNQSSDLCKGSKLNQLTIIAFTSGSKVSGWSASPNISFETVKNKE